MNTKKTDHGDIDLLTLIADDQGMISYRPSWNQFTGSINATILLQQIIYRWAKHGRQPFYKFSAPCSQPAYRQGDSWQEELGMSRKELENARRKIAISTQGELSSTALISYWRDRYHKTWYALNESLLIDLLGKIYATNQQKNVGIQSSLIMVNDDLPMHQTGISTNAQKGHQPMPKSDISTNAPFVQGVMHQTGTSTDAQKGHQPMYQTGIGTNAPKVQSYSRDNNKEDSKDYYKDNNNNIEPASAKVSNSVSRDAVPVAASSQILDWMGFNGRLTQKDGDPPPDVLLAWAYWVRVERDKLAAKGKNAVGIARAGWRRGDVPGGGWTSLARLWLEIDDSGRWDLIEAAEDAKYSGRIVLTRQLEEIGLSTGILDAFSLLWKRTNADIAPQDLMPNLEADHA